MITQLQRGWQTPGWLNRILLPVAWIYAGMMWCRRRCYIVGLLKQHRLSVPVVVVGNISVGGTGKTPLVVALVEYLKSAGNSPGVIARGYRGNSAFWPRAIVEADTAMEVGDEPLMIYRRCGVPVVVGPDRIRSAHMLVEKFKCDIIVSDDGFQHLALARDIDIVVVDGERRFGNGWCLPSGPLREPPSTVDQADIVVVNSSKEPLKGSEFSMQIEAQPLIRLEGGEIRHDLSWFGGKTVHAIAGLGNPERFFNSLEKAGLNFIPHRFPDHHGFTTDDFAFINEQDIVIMTEKDAIKCTSLVPHCDAWILPVRGRMNPEFFGIFQSKLDRSFRHNNSKLT